MAEPKQVVLDHRQWLAQDFALVNPLQVEALHWEDLPNTPLVAGALQEQQHLFPRLVTLRSLPEPQRMDLLGRSERWQRDSDMPLFSALLQSRASPGRVASHLTKRMLLVSPEDGQVWLRYHDPRVFKHLEWLFTDAQMRAFFGPIEAWTWCDPLNGKWYRRSQPESAPSAGLQLSKEQWGSLRRMKLLNLSLRAISRKSLQIVLDGEVASRLDGYLREAIDQEGMSEPDDVRLYAEHALRYGVQLHQHPTMRTLIEDARTGECSYVGSCAELSDADLSAMAKQSPGAGRMRA